MKYQGIYKIRNLKNGKVYIGQSVDINKRFRVHKSNSTKSIKSYLYDSIRYYSIENFEFVIVEKVINKDDLDKKEHYWIDYYKSSDKNYGYNLCPLAESPKGYKHTEEAKLKISKATKEQWNNLSYRNKMVKLSRNKKVGEETRKKLSASHLGQKAWNKGIPCKNETKLKISQSSIGKKHTEQTKLKLSILGKGKIISNKTRQKLSDINKGKKLNNIIKFKISEAIKNLWNNPLYREKMLQARKIS